MEVLEHQKQALNEAISWIERNYTTIGIIASGSIIHGNPSPTSDFDIYVIHEEKFRQRVQKYFNNVPCEIFINSIELTKLSFLAEQNNNRPVTAHMIANGILLKGDNNENIISIIKEAKDFQFKPKVLTSNDETFIKYGISNLLEDANDVVESDPMTCEYILVKVIDKIIDFWFLKKQLPLSRIKERMCLINSYDPEFYVQINKAFQAQSIKEKLEAVTKIVENIIGEKGYFEWTSERS
jgi:predicted nucleotidyltransferase